MTMFRAPVALATALVLTASADAAQPIAGRYLTQDGAALVAVETCGAGNVCGKIARIVKAKPGAPATDVNNKNAALRARPILGMPILTGFVDKGDDWRGAIYDPRSGKTYKSIVTRNADGSLKVKGCIAFLCQTQTWKPAG